MCNHWNDGTTASAIMIPIGQTGSVVKGLIQFAIGEAGAYTAGQVAYHGTKLVGGSEEDAQTANFIGNLVGGYVASSAASKFSLNKVKVDVEAPKYNREQILRNIEESRLARESSGFKDFATRERYLEKVFDKLTPEERELIFNISKNSPKVKYKNGVTQKSILEINKGDRPNPEDIYNSTYLKMHNQQFKNGASRFQKFQPSENWNGGIVGGRDGTSFWLSKEHADIIEKVANGDNRLYEIILGFDEGYLGDGPLYRLDVTPEVVAKKGISIPSGNEVGANDWWRPTGRTFPGDIPEGVMEDISTKRGEHTWNIVN